MSKRKALAIWIPAAIGAVALHLACVGLVYANLPVEESDELGALAFEVGLDLLSPRAEATDLPPGPESDASAAAPAQMEEKEKVEETALPQDKPSETEEPDRIVADTAPKKPIEEERQVAAIETNASAESASTEATMPAPVEGAREAPVATAPAAGIGSTGQDMSKKWKSLLSAHLNRFKRYPVKSARRNAEVQVSFTLDRRGHLKVASVLRGSGDPAFDEAALAMLRRADPLPPPPTAVTDDELSFTVPIVYRVKGRR